jgi:CMP-N-acetylneuraminic acid synthetase
MDQSTVVQVCLHTFDHLSKENKAANKFCCIYATAIFLIVKDLHNSFNFLHSSPVDDVVMGVTPYNFPPAQALKEEKGYLQLMWPKYAAVQSKF